MYVYGLAPALFIAKTIAIVLAIALMLFAHSRRWIRPIILGLIIVYVTTAVLPWTYLIAAEKLKERNFQGAAPVEELSVEFKSDRPR